MITACLLTSYAGNIIFRTVIQIFRESVDQEFSPRTNSSVWAEFLNSFLLIKPIRTHYLGHVTGYQPIRDQYFLIRSVPGLYHTSPSESHINIAFLSLSPSLSLSLPLYLMCCSLSLLPHVV
eukprot:sb/3475956/